MRKADILFEDMPPDLGKNLRSLLQLIEKLFEGKELYQSYNSIDCLIECWELRRTHARAAKFLAINAQEEAAACLIGALSKNGYEKIANC